MSTNVFCTDCKLPLDEVATNPGDRKCPKCGSTNRSVQATGNADFGFVVAGEGRSFLGETLLTQAVIVPGQKTHEGALIESVTSFWADLVRLFQQQPEMMYKIDPFKLEELVAGMYEKRGYQVTLTPRSGDRGRDVIAVWPGFGTVRLIESVKRYGPGHRVPANDVRALAGVLMMDPRASKGIVTTTSEFAPRIEDDPLIKPFLPYRIELVNGTELLKRLSDLVK
jgi:restriction system protein